MTKTFCDICRKEMCDSAVSLPNKAKPYHLKVMSGDVRYMAQILPSCSKELCVDCYEVFINGIKDNGIYVTITDHKHMEFKLFDNIPKRLK